MGPENISTNSLIVGLLLSGLLLVLPRRYTLVPMVVAGCYMTLGQALVVGGLHLYLFRILILFGFIRIVVRGELFQVRVTAVDRILAVWVLVSSLLYVLVDGSYVSLTERLG